MFEDAAGVKQYQIQKERALRKLVATRENLVRVDSLLQEIEPHLKTLKRQAERAAQGKDVAERLLSKQIDLYGFLWHSFQSEKGTLSDERERIAREAAQLERDTDTLREELGKLSGTLEEGGKSDELLKEASVFRERLNTIERELAIIHGRTLVEEEKRKDREEIRTIPVDLGYIRKALDMVRANQVTLVERLGNVEKLEDIQDLREFARAINQELVDLDVRRER